MVNLGGFLLCLLPTLARVHFAIHTEPILIPDISICHETVLQAGILYDRDGLIHNVEIVHLCNRNCNKTYITKNSR